MSSFQYFVQGRPAPKGSYSRGRAGSIRPASRHLAAWSEAVRRAVASSDMGEAKSSPLVVQLDFLLARPKSHYRRDGTLTIRSLGAYPRLDLDKLVRATMDPLVAAGLILDDSQAIELHASKRYSMAETGCHIGIYPVLP